MRRKHLLAAELYAYSFAHYADHLGIGHARFERLMPREAELLERAEREGWTDEHVARAIECDPAEVAAWREAFREAVSVVDAPTPAEAFRRGVRQSIRRAVAEGLASPEEIEKLVVQVCYRAADLAFLLDRARTHLSDYSKELRQEPAPSGE